MVLFEYDSSAPLDIRVGVVEHRGEITVSDITFAGTASGSRIGAYLVTPSGAGPFAGALFVHWYEPEASNSNRTQFLDEAVALAERGVVSLLVETFWSRIEWFSERKREDDYAVSVRQTSDLRRALDVLIDQPGVDPERVAIVGHDFGGMFGAIVSGTDGRPCSYVIMAATPLFSDWYLYGPPMPEDEKIDYVKELAAIDPVVHIANAGDRAFLFQFGRSDRFVPEQKALDFYEAASGDKRIEWYDVGHDLDVPEAYRHRSEWLHEQLGV
jgi:predicted esterase